MLRVHPLVVGGLGLLLVVTACGGGGDGGGTGPSVVSYTVENPAALIDTADQSTTVRLLFVDGDGAPIRQQAATLSADVEIDPWTGLGFRYVEAGIATPAAPGTDADGRLLVGMARFTDESGSTWLHIRLPNLDFEDSILAVNRPGHAVRAGPADTAVYAGGSIQARLMDRLGNATSDPVQVTVLGPGLSASAAGLVTVAPGTPPSRTYFVVRGTGALQAIEDTAWISVVPQGKMAGILGEYLVGVTLDGSQVFQIDSIRDEADQGSWMSAPVWAPDGAAVLTALQGPGLVQYRLATAPFQAGATATLLAPNYPAAVAGEGEYTADGQQVFFSKDFTATYRIAPGGTTATKVAPVQQGGGYTVAYRPSPSPDGSKVAVVTDDQVLNGVIRVIDVSTGVAAPWYVSGQRPRWHPSLPLIAFTGQGGGPISVIAPDGSAQTQVSPPGVVYYENPLSWSPDGEWLLARGPGDDRYSLIHRSDGRALPIVWRRTLDYATLGPP